MTQETTVTYLENLILAERNFAGACDLARMNLHQPLTQQVLDEMQQSVTCALGRLAAAQDLNMPPPPVETPTTTSAPAVGCATPPPPVETPTTEKQGCCGGGCQSS